MPKPIDNKNNCLKIILYQIKKCEARTNLNFSFNTKPKLNSFLIPRQKAKRKLIINLKF